MSGRSTPGSSAIVSHATAVTGPDDHEAQVAFHDLRRAGTGLPAPAAAAVASLLATQVRRSLRFV